MFLPKHKNQYAGTEVTVEVVSKTKITEEKIASLGKLIRMMAPKTAKATLNYLHYPNLFDAKLDSSEIGFKK